jgi:hypothetical protein
MEGKYDDKKKTAANRMIQNELLNIANNMKKRLADTKNFLKKERDPEEIKEYLDKDEKEQNAEIKKIQALYKEMNAVQRKGPKRIREEDSKKG